MKHRWKTALELFWYFFKIGWFTFGGGWSIVAQMEKDFVAKGDRISSEELLDMVSVGRSLPGTMIGNVAYLFGYSQGGVIAGIFAVCGVFTPPLIILAVLTLIYTNVRDNLYVGKAMIGVRAAVAPIIFNAAMKLRKGAFPKVFCYVLCIAGLLLSVVWDVSCVFIVAMGLICGIILGGEKKEAEV